MTELIFSLILILIGFVPIFSEKPTTSGGFFLSNKTFSIWSEISAEDQYGVSRLVNFDERYSYGQKRARLDYHFAEKRFKDSSSGDSVIYDQASKLYLLHEKHHNHFYKGNLDSLYEYLFPNCELPALLAMAQADSKQDYLVGPAGLLFLIFSNRNKLKLVEKLPPKVENFTKNAIKIEGNNMVEYSLAIDLEEGKKVELNIYYDSVSDDASSFAKTVPVQVLVSSGYNSMAISYFGTRICPEGIQSSSVWAEDMAGRSHSDRIIDYFTFPLLAIRPTSLSQSDNQDQHLHDLRLLLQIPLSSSKFSFVAETTRSVIMYSHGRSERHLVAFDGSIMSLRVDLLQTGTKSDVEQLVSKSLYDFRLNRRYSIVNNGHSERSRLMEILQRTKTKQCSVLEGVPSDILIDFKKKLSISKLLFGCENFEYMGRALLRGTPSKVFEVQNSEVPFWFDQPFWYLNVDGVTVRDARSDRLNSEDNRFTSLIYLSDESPARLLSLEIYGKEKKSLSEPLVRLNFHNFLWDLSDSFDGDKANELFSLRDECGTSDGHSRQHRHAEISLMLQEPEVSPVKRRRWIATKPLERNEALLSALTHSLFIQPSMLFDFNSKIISDHSYLQEASLPLSMVVNMRVAEHPSVLQSIRFVGFGKLTDNPNVVVLTESVQSLLDCLLMFSHPSRTIFVFYSENNEGKKCIFSRDLMLNSEQTIDNLKDFKLTKGGAGKIYRVAPKEDGELRLVNNWFESTKFNHFENREITLQNNHEDNDQDKTIKLRYKKIDVKVFDPSNRVQVGGYFPIVEGYGFRFGPHIRRVMRQEAQKGMVVDRVDCQAACMADLECKSFSYCLHLLDSECLLSNVSLAGKEVHDQVNATKITNQKFITVEVTPGNRLDLIRDLKCEIVNKNYLELFTNNQAIRSFVTDEEIYEVEDGVQCCAQICFSKSLTTVQSVIELKKQIEQVFHNETYNSNLRVEDKAWQEIIKTNSSHEAIMKSFCKSYIYIDAAQLNQRETKILSMKASKNNTNPTKTPAGYCLLTNEFNLFNYLGNWELNPDDSILYPARQYYFDFTSLYHKTHGFRLAQSSLSDPELKGFRDLSSGKPVDESTLELLRETIIDKKNYQFKLFVDASACAKKCFVQDGGFWPSCRSFDIIVEHSKTESLVTHYCLLNTMSLGDVSNQLDLVVTNDSVNLKFSHYEPRAGFAREEAKMREEIYMFEMGRRLNKEKPLNAFSIFGLLVVSLVGGILLGMFTTQKFVIKEESTKSYPTYSMSSLLAKFDGS